MKLSIKTIAMTALLTLPPGLVMTSCSTPDARQDNRDYRQDGRQDSRDDRQDNRSDRRDDRWN